MEKLGNITLYNADCMEIMKGFSDKQFELALVDPPYGIERFKKQSGSTRFKCSELMQRHGLTWDVKPDKVYFDELFRVSKNQIIWGANNFILPPTEYFIIWDKQQTVDNFACAEYAWVSIGLKKPSKIFRYSIQKHNHTEKIHPTQKPIALYKWILKNYAKEGDTILDTHLGSGSSAIAAHDGGFEFTGIELDEEYFNNAVERIKTHQRQLNLF